MMKWEKQARLFKQKQKDDEVELEKQFRKRMIQQFAEDERMEQYTLQVRKMKELEYKKEIEKQW